MMPMKATGPESETAALVASDALTKARRCARGTSTPRAAAASGPRLSRFSAPGSEKKIANAMTTSGSDARIGAKAPTSRSPMSQRTAR